MQVLVNSCRIVWFVARRLALRHGGATTVERPRRDDVTGDGGAIRQARGLLPMAPAGTGRASSSAQMVCRLEVLGLDAGIRGGEAPID